MREFLFRAENFRAFSDTDFVSIRPITLLVGENSTGKSSFLAALYFLLRMSEQEIDPNINSIPFDLGSFEQIAHKSNGNFRNESCFHIKQRVEYSRSQNMISSFFRDRKALESNPEEKYTDANLRVSVEGIFGSPCLTNFELTAFDGCILGISIYPKVQGYFIDEDRKHHDFDLPEKFIIGPDIDISKSGIANRNLFVILLSLFQKTMNSEKGRSITDTKIADMICVLGSVLDGMPGAVEASSPLRSTPERVYSSTEPKEIYDGSSTPYYLRKAKIAKKETWNKLRKRLSHFGRVAGLFSDLDIARLTKELAGPFQIKMKIGDRRETIADVGYGVSQVLPIITNIVESDENTTFLIQQPEVHLHPRAQAGLGTFFSEFISKRSTSNLVIETHSDYIIDRIRFAIRSKNISNLQVVLLYFEDLGSEVKIHEIGFEKNGDLVDPPPCYRDFFVSEQMQILGLKL